MSSITIQVDSLGMIVEVIYLGIDLIEGRNIGRLVGWHESFLNSASLAFEHGMVSDWIGFFREEWAYLVYHDNFTSLVGSLRDSLQLDKGMFSILDQVFDSARNTPEDGIVVGGRRKLIGDRSESLPEMTKKLIETQTLDFLRKNKAMFPGFYIPSAGGKRDLFESSLDKSRK